MEETQGFAMTLTALEGTTPMILNLVYCKNCASCPFLTMVDRLEHEYPDDLRVTELDCIAACDTPPSVILEYDFYPSITPDELYQRVHDQFAHEDILHQIAQDT